MNKYKLASYIEFNNQINESISLALLMPIIAITAGKLIGSSIVKLKGNEIKKSMDNLIKSRFTENAKEKDVKNLYNLIKDEYPKILKALDNNDNIELSKELIEAGLDSTDIELINQVINKLRDYHQKQKN